QQQSLAESLLADCADLPACVQPGKIRLGDVGAFGQRRIAPAQLERVRSRGGDFLGHDARQMLRPEAELLVQGDVLRALREREEPALADAPFVEYGHGGLEQALANAGVPAIWANAERAENPETAPARGNARADQLAVAEGAEGGFGLRAPARPDHLRV